MKVSEETIREMIGSLIQSETRRSFILNCPTCQREKFYVEKSTARSVCFYCSKNYKPEEAIALLLHVSRDEAQARLYQTITSEYIEELVVEFDEEARISDSDFTDDSEELTAVRPDFLSVPVRDSDEGLAYLHKRGVTDTEKIERFGILYHPLMKGVMFPVVFKGICVGSQTRLLEPDANGLRMRSSPGLPKAKVLLNYDHAVKQPNIVLTEGPFDCIKADQPEIGFGAVASFGKGVSPEQVKLLLEAPAQNIYLGLDRDAVWEVERLCRDLCVHKNVFRVLPPDHRMDLGECTDTEVRQALATAEPCYREKTARLELFMK